MTSKPNVLVVDDQPDSCHVLVKFIEHLGYKADCVMSGRAALEFLSVSPPDLVLLDTMMPVMDGIEVLSQMRNDPALKKVPVVMHSALSDRGSISRAMAAGAQDYLVKAGYTFKVLQDVIEKHLGHSASTDVIRN